MDEKIAEINGAGNGPNDVLCVVRYGLAKEIILYPSSIEFLAREEGNSDNFELSAIQKISLTPGEHLPSKLLLLLQFTDDTTIIAAEGMTNVRDFIQMVSRIRVIAPHILFDPENMEEQLQQALYNKRVANMGCYGAFFAVAAVILLLFILGITLRR